MGILRKNGTKLLNFLSKDVNFYALLVVEIILFTWLNWENEMMTGILRYYEDYANYFASGFDASYHFKAGAETFPMWGYGVILLLTKNKIIIILAQQLLTIYTIYKAQQLLKELAVPESTMRWLRLFIILSFSWFIFHTALWPYSISANLLILSLLYLSKGYYTDKFKFYVLSAVLFGIMLNFRSDYLYYFFALSLLLITHHIFVKKKNHLFGLAWAGVVLLMLVPWGIYTQHKTGHYLLNSTNGGHVLYISLGQLPGNKWGITAIDNDPKMKTIVKNKLGPGVNTMALDCDKLLKNEWKENIKNDPAEYIKKCLYNVYMTFVRPFANGEIYKKYISDKEEEKALKDALKKDISTVDIKSLLGKFTSKKYIGFFIPIVLNVFSILCFLFFLFCLLIGIFKYRQAIFSNWLILTLYTVIGYQLALQTLAFYNPNYHTNVLIFYAIVAAMVVSRLPVDFMNKKEEIADLA